MQAPDLKRTALFIAILAGFLTPFDLSAVVVALPSIGAEFSMDAIALSWISTAYLLAAGVFLVPFGRIADIRGRKKVFVVGLSLFLISSMLMIFSISPLMVILLRILQGSGAAMIFGTSVAILTEVTPLAERGKALGIYTTAVYCGLSLGPFIGGFLTTHFGWRSIFLVNLPIGLIAVGLIALYLKGEWADSKGEPFDLGGSIQYGLTLICVMYGFSLLPDREGFILLIAGSVMLGVFILRELRVKYPLLNMNLFRNNRIFTFSSLAALINYAATFSITFFLSLYLQYIRGFPASYAGTILVIQPVVMAIFSSWAGRLSDRIEPAKIASAGMAILAG
jgi:MFS family permease